MVTYRLDGQEYGNLAADVSSDGIFIRTFMPPEVGTRLDVTISLGTRPGAMKIDLKGVVRRRVDSDDPRQNGMGIQFTSVEASDPGTVRFIVSKFIGHDAYQAPHDEGDPLDFSKIARQMDDGDTEPSI